MFLRIPTLVLVLFVSATMVAARDRPIRVAFINTLIDPVDEPVWSLFDAGFVRTSKAAALQLGIEFNVVPAFRPETMVAETTRLCNGPDRPDYLIVTIHRGIHDRLLQIAEQAKMPVFVINAGLVDEDRQRVGGPREHYKYWIGEMLPDDEQAGYELAKILIERAKKNPRLNHGGRVSMGALSGREVDGAAILRNRGLERAVAEDSAVSLVQVVPGAWDRVVALSKTPLMIQRYPDITAIWTANDGMAMGVVAALEKIGRKPGTDVLVGGMNWDSDAMRAIADGRLAASMGGHFLECAWALILLCDYDHGIDFASERVDWHSGMRALTPENIQNYAVRLETFDWSKADYRRLSKFYSPERKTYHFSVDELYPGPASAAEPPSADRSAVMH